MYLRFLSLLLLALLFGVAAIGAPVANPDDFETAEDMALSVDTAQGLLANDVDSTAVALQDDVGNGVLDLNADGSFTYTPDENFNGQDTFTYVSQKLPQTLTFTVSQSMSEVDFAATISAAGITQTRSDSSSITGTLQVHLRPPGEPFDVVHVRDVDLVVADDISLNYRVSIIFPIVDVTVSAEGGAIELDMLQAGLESAANGAGEFAQPSNDFQLRGDANVAVDVDTLGLGIPEGAQALDTALEDVDLNGTLSESGGIITLNMPVTFEGIFDLSGNPVTVEIDGLIVATAPVPTVETSSPATVTIDVDPVNDSPLALSERYRTTSGSALTVAATPAGGGEVLLAAGSTWRYLDDGSDQGMAWREAGFDDAAWATGAAKLGYGEGDEVTVIGFGGDPDNVHVTSYFRAEFDVADPNGAGELLLRLQRDDGAAVYLNGIEVARDGLPEDAAFDALASEVTGGTDEEAFFEFTIPASAMVAGTNTIAVEVHQASIDSSDVSFDLELVRSPTAGVLANDSDLDGDTLSAVQVGPATGGTVLLGLDGSFTFTPATGFSGEGGFVYAVSDGAGTAPVPIVPADAIWRYLDNGTDQGTAWTATGFDDSSWPTGAAELGYGEDDEATVVGFGGNPENKFQTTYFRHEFNLGDPAAIAALTLRLVRDDAAAVYVNGTEVYRDGTLPVGATFLTLASAPVDESMIEIAIAVTPGLLDVGANVIAVEVHQSSLNSSDLSFSLSATAQAMPPQVVVSPGATWSYLDDGSDQGTAWSDPAFDDSTWDAGAGPLGYGSGEATTVSFGGDPDNKHATTYFRHRFEVVGASGANAGILKVRRDDGVAVYLNGTEIARDRVAPGAGAGDFATGATSDSLSYRVYGFDPALLMEGENVLAAEVHQASGTSSDIVFDAELSFSSAQVLRVARVDVVGGGDGDTDMDGMADSYEVANGLTVGVDDSALDLDGDGRSNLSESIAGTAANDSNSFLRIVSIAPAAAPGSLEITIEMVPGKVYQLQSSADGETWGNVGDTWMAAGMSQMVTEPAVGDELFWRAAVVVP